MKYIGFDMGDGESAVAAFEHGSGIEPVIWPVCGAKSLLSAVGLRDGEIVIGERAYTDALAQRLSVRFKSRFTTDLTSYDDVEHFVRGVLADLGGRFSPEDRFVVGCPAGWNAACRARYRDLLIRAGIPAPQVISESRAAFLYAKYARTVALDVDVLNQSALVIDMGSSTLDYAYIVDGRETGVGTFGENALGGGILDAALLRRAVERCREKRAVQAVFKESRSWYSYCEIEARRVKEAYFSQLETQANPHIRKRLRVCYDGLQTLQLELDSDEASLLVDGPLPELGGQSFTGALKESFENASRLTADHPPELILLTGGASRMPFVRDLCREVFSSSLVVSCPEPEFSIAKGLAYAGWVDENLHAFREAIQAEISQERIAHLADEALPRLLPSVADLLTDLMLDEAALPIVQQWKRGGIGTLKEMETQIAARVERVLNSPLAQEALAPAVELWTKELADQLQAMIDPICDRYHVPRKAMQLDVTASGAGSVQLDKGAWSGLSMVGTVLGALVSVLSGLICGGSGVALVAAGPAGFAAGLVIGAVAMLLGWGPISSWMMQMHIPLFLRGMPIEKRLKSDQTRRQLQSKLMETLSPENSAFRRELSAGFAASFHQYLLSIAQSAEIPIDS